MSLRRKEKTKQKKNKKQGEHQRDFTGLKAEEIRKCKEQPAGDFEVGRKDVLLQPVGGNSP